jgi:hypothetical protein
MKKIDQLFDYMIKINPDYNIFDYYFTNILHVNLDQEIKINIYNIIKHVIYLIHNYNIDYYIGLLLSKLTTDYTTVNHIFFGHLELDINRIMIYGRTNLTMYLEDLHNYISNILSINNKSIYHDIIKIQNNLVIFSEHKLESVYKFIKNNLDYNYDIYLQDNNNKNVLDYAYEIDKLSNTNLQSYILNYHMIKDPGYD